MPRIGGAPRTTYRGAYDNASSYSVGDLVGYNGTTYVARTSTLGNLPTDNTYWAVFAAAGTGVPAGGTTGQALIKKSATAYDTEWGTVAGGGGGGSTGGSYPTWVVNKWNLIVPVANGGAANTVWVPTTNPIGMLMRVPTACTISQIGLFCNVAGVSDVVTIGMYADLDGRPGTVIGSTASLDVNGTGARTVTLSTPATFTAGRNVWMMFHKSSGSASTSLGSYSAFGTVSWNGPSSLAPGIVRTFSTTTSLTADLSATSSTNVAFTTNNNFPLFQFFATSVG